MGDPIEQEDWKLLAHCRSATANTSLIHAAKQNDSNKRVTVYVANEGFDHVTGPLVVNFTPELAVKVPQLQLNEFSNCWHSTFELPSNDPVAMSWTVKCDGGIFDDTLQTFAVNIVHENAVFVQSSQSVMLGLRVFNMYFKCMWSLFHAEPVHLSAQHAQLLSAGLPLYPALECCIKDYALAAKTFIPKGDEDLLLVLLGHVGQYLELSEEFNRGNVADVLWKLLECSFSTERLEQFGASPASFFTKRLVKWLYEFDRCAPVSSFRYTTLTDILGLLGDEDILESDFGKPLKNFALQKNHLPDFKVPAAVKDQSEASKGVDQAAHVAWGNLERSETLQEREVTWEKSVKSAEATLHRLFVARKVVLDERAWVRGMVTGAQHAATESGVPGWGVLKRCQQASLEILSGIDDSVTKLEMQDLYSTAKELAKRGRETREETKALVELYGPYIGHNHGQSFGITTVAGFHRAPKLASIDGPLMFKKDPYASLMPSSSVTMENGTIIFTEPSTNKIRCLNTRQQTLVTLLGANGSGFVDGQIDEARLRGPNALVKISETEILVSDAGNACLRVMRFKDSGWSISLAAGQPGVRGNKDGVLKTAAFTSIRSITTVEYRGQTTYYIADGSCIRRIVAGLKSGKVETVTTGASVPCDGPCKSAKTVEVRCLWYEPSIEMLFFIDRHALRGVDINTKGTLGRVRTIFGNVNKSAPTKNPKSGFDTPCGLAFTRVPRETPLEPDVKAREEFMKAVEKSDPKNLAVLMGQYDAKDKMHRTMQSVLIVSDTNNNCIRAVYNMGKRSHTFESVETQIILGRGNSTHAWKDGMGSVSQLCVPGSIMPNQDGSFILCEQFRMRLIAPPFTLRQANSVYTDNQQTIEELADKITLLSKNNNIHSAGIIDAVRTSRLTLLKGRNDSEEASYKQYAEFVMDENLPHILTLIAAAPSVHCLRWIITNALARKVVSLDLDRTPSVSHDTKDNDLPYNLSSLPQKPLGLLDAIEASISRVRWLPSEDEQRAVLQELIRFTEDVPDVFGPVALEKLLQAQGFRVRPCKELLTLVQTALSLHTADFKLEPQEQDALNVWLVAAIPKEMENEKMSNEKVLRGTLRLWIEYYENSECEELKHVAAAMQRWTLGLSTQSKSQRQGFLQSVGVGLSRFIEPHDESMEPHAIPEALMENIIITGKEAMTELDFDDTFVELTDCNAAEPRDWFTVDDRAVQYALMGAKINMLECLGKESEVGELLKFNNVWKQLLPWYTKIVRSPGTFTSGENWEALSSMCKAVGNKFNVGASNLLTNALPTTVVTNIIKHKENVVSIWKAIGIAHGDDSIEHARSLLSSLNAEGECFEDVAHALLEENDLSNFISDIRQRWGALPVRDIMYVFRKETVHTVEGMQQLPPVFMRASRWLHEQCGSGVFHFVWNSIKEADIDTKIAQARARLLELYDKIDNKTMSFTDFMQFTEMVTPESHVSLATTGGTWNESQALRKFCLVCRELQEEVDVTNYPATGRRLNNNFFSQLTETVLMFRRMQRLQGSSGEILRNVDYLSALVRPSGQATVDAERQNLGTLIEEVSKFDYDKLTLQNLTSMTHTLGQIDDRILDISCELLEALNQNGPFLEWLSDHASNQNFASSIEMAMGRPEMECPPELWVAEETGPGHPNESILSQLSGVRTSLHKLLYSAASFMRDTITQVVDCLGHLSLHTSVATAKAISELSPLQLALAELLSGDGDASALNRLHNLSLPSWQAEWVISGDVKASEVTMWLEYKVDRNGKVIDSKQTVGELLDYQSAVVLAKGRDDDVVHVQEFVAKFGWVRELCIEFLKLKRSGHPERQGFAARVPFSLASKDIHEEVKRAQKSLNEWSDLVEAMRMRYPLINTVMLRQLLRMSAEDSETGIEGLTLEIKNTLFPAGPLKDVTELLRETWSGDDAKTAAGFISKIDMMMTVAPLEWYTFPTREIDFTGLTSDSGVKLIVTDMVLPSVLSAYVRRGMLPEWHQLLWVTEDTTSEQICNLLLRWAMSEAAGYLFCLVGIEEMQETDYHKVTSLLLDLEPKAKNALLVVSSSRDNYVVRQLAHWREASAALPVEELQNVGVSVSQGEKKVTVYTAKSAGAGKTFQINTDAGTLKIVHVPLHKTCKTGNLITLIEANKKALSVKKDEAYVLHVDVADSVDESVTVILFELLVLGSLYDAEKGIRWFLDSNVNIAVETAPLAAQLPIFSFLNKKVSVVNKDTFKINSNEIKNGMRTNFTVARCDGTIYNSVMTTTSSTAYNRLVFVARIMSMVDETKKFNAGGSVSFQLKENTLGMISRAANLSEPVSLWAVWSFVDVVYWMAHSTFLSSSLFRDTPHQIRAEAFDFICRTAADFATRQRRVKGDDLMWLRSAEVSKGSDGSVLGTVKNYYKRCQFRSNGQPVFRMGSYLDPSYIHFLDDRWVMSNAIGSKIDITYMAKPGQSLLAPWELPHGTISIEFLTWDQLAKEKPDLAKSTEREDNMIPLTNEPLGDLKTWNEANHEALLTTTSRTGLHLLAVNVTALKKKMHPGLLSYFENSTLNVSIGANEKSPHEALSALTGIVRDAASAARLLGGTYCMTGDVVLKMLAVFVRVRCGVPILLMGECGCGKTHMLRYVCAWLEAELLILDVHGGTTEADILKVFSDANALITSKKAKGVYVFLDEVNTCQHMGLIAEVIVGRTLYGKIIHNNIHVLAAANPYRMRKHIDSAPGLAYKPPTRTDVAVDPLENLVYRVHPIPTRLQEFVFDFGSLSETVEAKYIKAMVAVYVHDKEGQQAISLMLMRAQSYVREVEGDPSVVSLRDLKRALKLSKWFAKYGSGKPVPGRHAWSSPAVLGIAHVFYFRLSSDEHREKLLDSLRHGMNKFEGFEHLFPCGAMAKIIKMTMSAICGKLAVEDGIAMNQALKENLYVTLICIFNRVPIFVVGKPGSSKTLTLQVLSNNLKGDQSTNKFWAKFPALHIFPYQCSPLSTAAGIRHQYDIACSFQKKAERTIVVLLLDEVGLAEHSPDMPLKVLHGILVDPPIGIVGLSNWTLDAAKMNRAICLQRPEPASDDIHLTGEYILGTAGEGMQRLLNQLSVAYHMVYTNQMGRDFVGMRDYYQTVKLLKRERALLFPRACIVPRMQMLTNCAVYKTRYITISDISKDSVFTVETETMSVYDLTASIESKMLVPFRIITEDALNDLCEKGPEMMDFVDRDTDLIGDLLHMREPGGKEGPISRQLMTYALLRNFGGSPTIVQNVCSSFGAKCFKEESALDSFIPSPSRLISANLNDTDARHLMVLTENGAALPLLFSMGLIDYENTEVLVGSTFEDDGHDLHLIQQVNKVKAAMASGKVVLLHNHDSIYESLYDVLNQRYVVRTVLETGREKRMLRLAIGSRSQLCPVKRGFRIIVVAEQQHAYDNLDLPLLNRFEKQVLNFDDCLNDAQRQKYVLLKEWALALCKETTLENPSNVFYGFIKSTLPSLVFSFPEESLEQLQKRLVHIAMPIAMMQSSTLREIHPEYIKERSGLNTLLKSVEGCDLLTLVTYSPLEQVREGTVEGRLLRLSDIGSEHRLTSLLDKFFDGENNMLIMQCDPMTTPQNTIDHAKRVAESYYVKWCKKRNDTEQKRVLFLIHTPPGAKKCTRHFTIDYSKNWSTYFIDDVSEADESSANMLYYSLIDLVEKEELDISATVLGKLNTTLSLLQEPSTGHVIPFVERTRFVRKLFERKEFLELVLGLIKKILKDKCTVGATGLQHHVDLAVGELSSGSLRASVNHVVEYLLIQITAHILRVINVDFNLFTLNAESETLWYELARTVLSEEVIVDMAPVDGMPKADETKNTGTVRVLKAQFPFSYRLIQMHEKAREPIMKQSSINYEGLAGMAEQLHGPTLVSQWNEWAGGSHTKYLADLVTSSARQFQGLEWTQVLALHTAVLKATNPAVLSNPLALHAALWVNEHRLFHMSSLLSSVKPDAQDKIIDIIDKTPHDEQQTVTVRETLKVMEVYINSMCRLKKLADWSHRIYPSLVLDCRALGGDIGNWPLVADFIKLVVLQSPLLVPVLDYYVPALFKLEHKVAELEKLIVGAPVKPENNVKDAFLVTFLRDYALPAGDAVHEDILRLACGLRPKLYSGSGPALEPIRRGLFHTLVAHDGLKQTMKQAETMPMGPKYSESLAVLILGYLEDIGDVDSEVTDADLEHLREPKTLSHDYLLSLATARNELRRFSIILHDVCTEQAAIVVEEGVKRPLPKHSPKLSLTSRKLLEIRECGLFVLSLLAKESGFSGVTEFLQIGRNYNWFVKFDRVYAENCSGDVQLPMIMPLVCSSRDQFVTLKAAVNTALKGGAPAKKRAGDMFNDTAILHDVKMAVLCETMIEGALRKDFSGREVVGAWLAEMGESPLASLLTYGGWGPTGRGWGTEGVEIRPFCWPPKALPMQLNSVYPLVCQVALLSQKVKGTFLNLAATHPRLLKTTFLPSMPISTEITAVMQGLNEYVTWYRCPQGHLYSIGECGGPMQIGVCSHPGCRARIGGTNHVSVSGNVRLGGFQDVKKNLSKMKSEPGYVPDSAIEVMRPGTNLSRITCCVLRVMFYSALVVGRMGDAKPAELHEKITPKYLAARLLSSYDGLRGAAPRMNASDMLLLAHVAIDRVGLLLQGLTAPFSNVTSMIKFEKAAEDVVAPLFQSPKPILESAYGIVGKGGREEIIRKVFNDSSVDAIFCSKGLWKTRPMVTVAHFKNFFESNSINATKHPLLAAVCENEQKLCIIRYLADILEWQQIIFKVLEGDDLSRLQAHEIPASAVLARVNATDRKKAAKALQGYCNVFNEAMPLLPNLHECQANPFLDSKGNVNLQGHAEGERVLLSPQSPISFSLPSMVPGEVDAPGLCTIQLAGLLHRTHNQVVEQLKDVLPEQGEVAIPTLSYETPPEVSRRLLIEYDTKRDLIPLLYKYKVDFDDGYLGYDMEGIENELMTTVFTGKMPLQLQVAHFEYHGEVRQRGGLAALANLDQVATLPTAVEESITKELNTQQQLSMLLRLVGDAIHFVAAVGNVLKADTALTGFFKDVMGLNEEEIAAKVTPAVVKYGKVAHLKAMFLLAESLMSGGGAFHRVNRKYTSNLDEEEEMEIRRSSGHLKYSHLAGALRELIVGPLSGPDVNFPETESLKDYISYQDMDVGGSEWFDKHFPEILQLRHAVATYELINKLAMKQ